MLILKENRMSLSDCLELTGPRVCSLILFCFLLFKALLRYNYYARTYWFILIFTVCAESQFWHERSSSFEDANLAADANSGYSMWDLVL